jgi:flagellar motility protein MotE (MotC chaperone)
MKKYKASFDSFVNLVEIPDFELLLTFAIGSRHLIHQDIAEKYQENKDYYYELFKSGPYYNDKRLASLSVFNYRAIQQFMGIYVHERLLNKDDFTLKLIKKGYRFVFNFVNNKKIINLYELRDGFLDYVKRNNFEKTINSAHLFAVALYLCKALQKEILFDEFDVTLIKNSIKQIFTAREFEPEITVETEEFLKQYQSIGLHKKDFQLPLNNLITSLNHVHRRQIAIERNLDLNDDNDQINELNKDHHFYKALSKIGIILQYCNIDPIDIQNVTSINHAKMKEIIALCFESQELELSESIYSLLGTYLVINGLATDYNTTKHHLIITSQEEKHNELLHLKREYDSKIGLLEKEEENQKSNTSRLTEKINHLLEKVTELDRLLKKKDHVIRDLNKEILSLQAKQNESLRLKNVFEEPLNEELTEEEMADYINKRKCVVVGGLPSWQDHLKTYLPSCRFVTPDEINLDMNFLLNVDLVFFNEAINNHSMYQKVKTTLINTDIPICYTGANTNIKISLKKMYTKLRET